MTSCGVRTRLQRRDRGGLAPPFPLDLPTQETRANDYSVVNEAGAAGTQPDGSSPCISRAAGSVKAHYDLLRRIIRELRPGPIIFGFAELDLGLRAAY